MAKVKGFSERIGACAVLFRASNATKVEQIAHDRGVTEDEAGRMYVVGVLKANIRRGTARGFEDALERFEAEQVGDRAVSVHGEAPICAEVRRINAVNETKAGQGAAHRRNMGVVLGSIYVGYDEALAATEPSYVVERESYDAIAAHVETAIGAYIDEYVTRLSRTAKASIHMIVSAAYDADAIMAGKDSESAKLRERAKYLHHNFPHAMSVTTREYVELLKRYAA